MNNSKQILIEARKIISDPDAWTQFHAARDANSVPVSPTDPAACEWCATGALSLAVHRFVENNRCAADPYYPALHALGDAVRRRFPGLAKMNPGGRMMKCNDMAAQRHDVILAIFADAIETGPDGGDPTW